MAIDFGTTFSAVSYVALKPGESADLVLSDRIQSIRNYPDDMNESSADTMKTEVPTEVIYPMDRAFRKKAKLASNLINQVGGLVRLEEQGEGEDRLGSSMQLDEIEDEDDLMIDEDSNSFKWGYAVHQALKYRDSYSNANQLGLTRFKLLLHEDPATDAVRRHLAPMLQTLNSRNVAKSPITVISDFLTYLLRHAKQELQFQGVYTGYTKEVVLCIPAIWKQQACRDMQTALASALQAAEYEDVEVGINSIKNLFVVSEPEAAAAFVLGNDRRIKANDTFVLLDAGGGTVDANTYTVSQTMPLRLQAEGAPPQGGLFGSSYLNEAFRDLVRQQLATETYLEEDGDTLDSIAETITITEFEYHCKRSFDMFNLSQNWKTFIEDAAARGVKVNKIVGIGGFMGSVSLRKYLQNVLSRYCDEKGVQIEPIWASHNVSAVASGAVLRALNKEHGPERYARSSYGVNRSEPYGQYDEHDEARATPFKDSCDGELYVRNTIDWILPLGRVIPPVWTSKPLQCSHNIPCHPPTPLVCVEVLYVSDSATKSHYSKWHRNNRGFQVVGKIEADFDFLKEQNLITPTEPTVDDKGRKKGKRHYKIDYTMILQVIDRDLKCMAFYGGEIITQCRINIAAGFLPGVK
ncbi:hypothetical protein JX266_009065 [Neoarthrinium moseri]|nr:hypothetical protein JX266_009065 [Neoarthrinium moseri]